MSSGIFFIILIILSYAAYIIFSNPKKAGEEIQQEQLLTTSMPKIQEEHESLNAHIVSEGDIPAEVFSEHANFDANDTLALLSSAENVYDFTNVKLGQTFRFYFNGEERAKRVEYDANTETTVVAERTGDDFIVRKEKINYDISEEFASVDIDEFLYKDALEAGLTEATILEIGDIFSFDIDFTTEIREGDRLDIIYEKRKRDGKDATDGRILAAKFTNTGTPYYAYNFEVDGENAHYDPEGRLLIRQFLRAPLSYRRITSGFTSARMHPITRTISAHYQIDYAAPTGTPVVATAKGTVLSAGWEGGWGNIVRIRHANGYTTHYGHLSSFAKGAGSGTEVAQGQVVGYVGSTGWSTGPHLDYGMRLNGSPVNPLALKLPKGNPLPEEEMESFLELKENYNSLLR